MIIEMVFHSLYDLIVLVSLASYQNHVSGLSQRTCRADCLFAVHYTQYSLALLIAQTCQHVVNDGLGIFKTRIVTCNDYMIAIFYCFLSH